MRYALLLGLLIPAVLPAEGWQSLEAVRQVAENFVLQHTRADASVSVRAAELDSRLRLARCDGRLEAFRPPGGRASGNTTVGVRCTGDRPWKLFVPVRSRTTGFVLVANRALARGESLQSGDVRLLEHDLGRLPYGYLTQPDEVAGQIVRRPVAPGTVLTPVMLDRAKLIRRGQSVTLYTDRGGVRIRMGGKALMDGAQDQRIRVENLSSGRVIEGVVRSAERVEILAN